MNTYFFRHSVNNSIRRVTVCGFLPENSSKVFIGISICHPKYDTFTKKQGRAKSKSRALLSFANVEIRHLEENSNNTLEINNKDKVKYEFVKFAENKIEEILNHFREVDKNNLDLMTRKLERKLTKIQESLSAIKQKTKQFSNA
jgi:hypothetical protein